MKTVVADVQQFNQRGVGDCLLNAEVVALGVGIMLVWCEKTDGLPQESAGPER